MTDGNSHGPTMAASAAKNSRPVRQPQNEQLNDQEGQGQGKGQGLFESTLRWILCFMAIQYFMGIAREEGYIADPANPKSSTSTVPGSESPALDMRDQPGSVDRSRPGNRPHGRARLPSCLWKRREGMDLHVYITDSSTFLPPTNDEEGSTISKYLTPPSDKKQKQKKRNDIILGEWHAPNLFFETNKMDESSHTKNQITNVTIPISKAIQYNETHLYAHVYLLRQRKNQQQQEPGKRDILVKTFPLTKHKVRKRVRDEKSLIGGTKPNDNNGNSDKGKMSDDASPLTKASLNRTHDQTLLYLKPSFTLQLVDRKGMPSLPAKHSIPPQILNYMDWLDDSDESDGNPSTSGGVRASEEFYYPILYSSEFWITKDRMIEVNGTLSESTIELKVDLVPMWKWQIMTHMEETWRTQDQMNGEDDVDSGGSSSDMFRTMLLETNPYLLIITGIVSIFHTIFDILAFKNDIKFFSGKKSMEGLSLRSMVVNTAFQVVILLYLADNETSFMVLVSNAMGLAIEIWKISKAVKVSFEGGGGLFNLKWEETKSYSESKTKEYDEIATSHLLFVTMPLVTGYAVYSLLRQKHRGWYSWILNSLVGFIYMFGFVMMTPQLFINYKLQSVAHLNWRTMTYKSINTFIDDLFAFVIKMPIMHRLACLRDDVIFLIFCYQRYKYRTDFTRVNEYGQCAEPTEEMLKEAAVAKQEDSNSEDIATTKSSSIGNSDNLLVGTKRRGAKDKRM